jgi:double-stranded uracil-DNA glycosylase
LRFASDGAAGRSIRDDPVMSHRVIEEWRGVQVETLEDLLRPGLRAVCVGINPAPTSVAAGHYYQGTLGQKFFSRLRRIGVLPVKKEWEDDAAFAAGIGFTDIVKRPTRAAADIDGEELEYGRSLLLEKLDAAQPELVIFTFKKSATVIFGQFDGSGFLAEGVAGADAYVMPGPYERADRVERSLMELRSGSPSSPGAGETQAVRRQCVNAGHSAGSSSNPPHGSTVTRAVVAPSGRRSKPKPTVACGCTDAPVSSSSPPIRLPAPSR